MIAMPHPWIFSCLFKINEHFFNPDFLSGKNGTSYVKT
jgi:hypothetical protein